ncbi:MAG: manganese catalase family protein [Clostridia bacterium]|nr:manganese catalase family protein [Clostridia bacterium]
MISKYALDTPYPEVRGTCAQQDMKMLMDLYSGRAGELTAITQYLYQRYLTDGIDETLANCLMGISKTEMRHHSLLGEAIVKMGGDPIMGGSTCFWSGSNVNYNQNPICFLQNNISAEQQAICNYRRAAACVNNVSLSELFLRIAQDEELHIEIFNELLEGLNS